VDCKFLVDAGFVCNNVGGAFLRAEVEDMLCSTDVKNAHTSSWHGA
jgi:hypothetical protein